MGTFSAKTGDKVPTIFGGNAASCCYQGEGGLLYQGAGPGGTAGRDAVIVRDYAPDSGRNPAQSSGFRLRGQSTFPSRALLIHVDPEWGSLSPGPPHPDPAGSSFLVLTMALAIWLSVSDQA
jgi:hypothetical protein